MSASLPPFARRHIGPSPEDQAAMLEVIGVADVEELIARTIPKRLRFEGTLDLPAPLTEREALQALTRLAARNEVWRSYLGYGYHDTITPPVVLRNVIENPGWYTAYTPYQAEISQGRLEALLVYQTVVQELTGLDIANASLLDEATAAAEAMAMSHRVAKRGQGNRYRVDHRLHPQSIAVIRTRAEPLEIEVEVSDPAGWSFDGSVFGAIVQYPATDGSIGSYGDLCEAAHAAGAVVTVATDLLALTLLQPPGQFGADIAIGNSQRFGVPLGYGGPHAAFMSTRTDFQRQLPGRVIGVSIDSHGNPALRMALQTREQHIRRQRATSNICTAQVLLAVAAGMYAVWHGPDGLIAIAESVHARASRLAAGLAAAGLKVGQGPIFDTVCVDAGARTDAIVAAAAVRQINLRRGEGTALIIALDETVTDADLADLFAVFGASDPGAVDSRLPAALRRSDRFLQQPVFHSHRSETEMLRWLHRLEARDLALNTSMIPLGSCTMKLNATTEMIPVTLPGFNAIHPFAPVAQAQGYAELFGQLEAWLGAITGFDAVSLQPNAGSQGEYAGLMVIREWHRANGDGDTRTVCLIPESAHGTNPASAVMAGMKVVVVKCDDRGNIDMGDLRAKAAENAANLGALMVTYPSTHGVFEESITEICTLVHASGGQVYMDGANMNAMVGLCRPADFGADVCHLNLHKTFCIPHGGGGPGMGPIGVKAHLAPHLPGHPVIATGGDLGPVSAAPWGSPSILPITWAYIAMLGGPGLTHCSEVAILNANYIAKRLEGAYEVLYRGQEGMVAHECILDTRHFKDFGVPVDDLAKRLMDYGFHAPTMSFPVVGTLMVEPTESESLGELDRFCQAMLSIRAEVQAVRDGLDHQDSPLAHAPHTVATVTADSWEHPYSRQTAAFPVPWLKSHKYWPTVGRIDNAYGDRNLICSCDAWPE